MTSGFASRAVARALAIAIGLAGPTFPVYAQQSSDAVDNSTPSPQAAQSKRQELPTVTPQHLFGDWGGVRTYLGDYGINLNLDFTTETAGNPTGGLRQGVDYAHQIGLELHPVSLDSDLSDRRAWFRKCHFQVTPEIDSALRVKGLLILGVTLI